MKILVPIIFFLAFSVSGAVQADNRVLECNSCSIGAMEAKAVAASTGGTYNKHYVANYVDGIIKHYRVIREPEIGVIDVAELSVSQNIQQEFDNYHNLVAQWDPEPIYIGSTSASSLSLPKELYSTEGTCTQGGGDNVYKYLSSGDARAELYNESFADNPILANAAASHRALVNIFNNLNYNGFSIDLPAVWSSIPFTLPTGGEFRGVLEYMKKSVEIQEGTVVDCSGNPVPMDAGEFFGNFKFESNRGFTDFIDWANLNGVPTTNSCGEPGPISCSKDQETGMTSCSVSCN